VKVASRRGCCPALDSFGELAAFLIANISRGRSDELADGVLQTYVKSTPTFGTCAGAILLATRVEGPPQRSLGALDITVERNAYGRQKDSSILTAPTLLGDPPLEMVFIRAPRITRTGPSVEILASRDNFPTMVRSGLILAATFHPELSSDHRVHQLFLTIIRQNQINAAHKRR